MNTTLFAIVTLAVLVIEFIAGRRGRRPGGIVR